MANKINTRIQLKYDSLEAWLSSTTKLLPGEIAIASLGTTTTTNKGLGGDNSENKTPIVGIKVGDGEHTFSELQWIQAIAGDVSQFVKEITNSTTFAAKVATATGYTAEQLSAAFTNITDNYATNSALNTGLNGKVDKTTYNQAVADLEAAIGQKLDTSTFTTYQGTVTAALNKKVETSVADSAASSTNKLLAETAIKKLIKDDATDPINTKIGELTNLTTTEQDTIVGAINELDAEIGDTSTFTGDDVSTAIKNLQAAVGTGADGLATKVSTLEGEMDEVQGTLTGYTSSKTVASAVADAKAAGTTAQGQVGTLGSLKTEEKTSAVAAINEVHDELDTAKSSLTSVSGQVETLIGSDTGKSVRAIATAVLTEELIPEGAADSLNTLEEIAQWIQDHPDDAAAMNARLEELKTALGGTGTVASGYTITPVSTQIDNKISALKLDDTYVNENDFSSYKQEVAENIAAGGTALQKADIATGSANGTISVDGDDVAVKGLGSAAYTASTAYATAAQGGKADTAIQTASFAGTAMTKNGTALSISQTAARSALGLGTAAYKADTYFGTAEAVSANATAISEMNGSLADGNGLVETISQTSGKISATRRLIKPADISTATADVFIFDCGNASRDA